MIKGPGLETKSCRPNEFRDTEFRGTDFRDTDFRGTEVRETAPVGGGVPAKAVLPLNIFLPWCAEIGALEILG